MLQVIMGVSVMSHFTMAAGMKQMEIIFVMTRRGTLVQFQANQDCYRKRKFRTVRLFAVGSLRDTK